MSEVLRGRESEPAFSEVYDGIFRACIDTISQAVAKRPFTYFIGGSHFPVAANLVEGNKAESLPAAFEYILADETKIVLTGEHVFMSYRAHIKLPEATQVSHATTGQYALFIDGTIRRSPIFENGELAAESQSISLIEAIRLWERLAGDGSA